MNKDRNAVVTVGDLLDFKQELKQELFEEMGRVANVIIEHVQDMLRGSGDEVRAVKSDLATHVADPTVHRQPRRARR